MAWKAWIATYNNVHGEDDVQAWIGDKGDYGLAVVADGVSATYGGGASFLAASVMLIACRQLLSRGLSFNTMKECINSLDEVARRAEIEDAMVVENIKKKYYLECSSLGTPCTTPLTLYNIDKVSLSVEETKANVEEAPSTTMLAALFSGKNIGFILLGDGVVMSTAKQRSKDELWIIWGALPQYYEGVKVARYIALQSGVKGKPVLLLSESEPGRIYVIATDGVDPALLAESLNSLANNIDHYLEKDENPAAEILRKLKERAGSLEDDASLAVIYHYS